MPSGGARARSGPAPDPNALRRGRKTDAEWTTLPAEGFTGKLPAYPLAKAISDKAYALATRNEDHSEVALLDELADARWAAEKKLWRELWRKPQATMWDRLGMKYQVAAYVRAFLASTTGDANSGLRTAVLRMEGELGLSVPGMNALRWKIARDELAEQRETDSPAVMAPRAAGAAPRATGARARLRALDAG